MKLLLCEGCLTQLAGKQKRFCSDRCRKRVIRKSDKNQTKVDKNSTGNTENFEPVQLFALFTQTLSDLNAGQFLAFQHQLSVALSASIEYEQVWQSRCLAHQDKFASDKAKAHETCAGFLQSILDFVQELRPEGGTN